MRSEPVDIGPDTHGVAPPPRARDVVRTRGWALTRITILHQGVIAFVLAPLNALALNVALSAAGGAAVVNEGLTRLITTPLSVVMGLLAGLLTLWVDILYRAASSLSVLDGSQDTGRVVVHVARTTRDLMAIALWQIARILMFAIGPILAAALAYVVLIGFRGPVSAYARNPDALVGIGVVLGTVLLGILGYCIVRWLFAPSVYLSEGLRGREALDRSFTLSRGRWVRLGLKLVGLFVVGVLAGSAVAGLGRQLAISGSTSANQVTFGLGLALTVATAPLVSPCLWVAGQAVILSEYLGARDLPLAAPSSERIGRLTWIVAGLVAGVGAVFVAVGLVAGSWFLERPVEPEKIELIAHRAGETYAPENSLAAVARARRDKADRLEFDVQRTADDQIVVIHDADLVRIAGADVTVGESTLAEVQAVDIGDGERVPTLQAFLDAAGDTPLALEIKTHEGDEQTTREVVELLQLRRALDRTVVMSLDPELTALARSLEPTLRTADLVSISIGTSYLLPSDIIAPSSSTAPTLFVFGAQSVGKKVWVWDVNDRSLVRQAALRGVDGIITNDVPQAREALESLSSVSSEELARQRIGDLIDSLMQ